MATRNPLVFVGGEVVELPDEDGIPSSGPAGGVLGGEYPDPGFAVPMATLEELDAHLDDTGNPHDTTKAQVGLSNVDNTADVDKPVSTAQAAADTAIGVAASSDATAKANAAQAAAIAADTVVLDAARAYADGLVVGLLDDRGNHNASTNTWPSSGGSGVAGAILKGDLWTISVAGTLGGIAVSVGDVIRALIDAPGSTASNWAVTENNLGFVPENSINKDTSGGYVGMSGWSVKLRNAANTFTNLLTNATTAVRTWTMPDKDGTVAMLSDITWAAPGAIGTTTPNNGAFTELSANGSATVFGNVGVGVVPLAWHTDAGQAVQINKATLGQFVGFDQVALTTNAYYSAASTWRYIGTAAATQYTHVGGRHIWSNAASGTAGDVVTFIERMRLDTSGNLGIGVSPSAWGVGFKVSDIGATGSLAYNAGNGGVGLSYNLFHNGTDWIRKTTAEVTLYQQVYGQHQWYSAASGSAGSSATLVERMKLDASGNLGLGVTPSAWSGNTSAIQTPSGAVYSFSSGSQQGITSNAFYNGSSWRYTSTAAATDYYAQGGSHFWRVAPSGTAGDSITYTQVLRITNSGDLIPGATDNTESLGSVSNRWATVYAGTGTINTSDAREKTAVSSLTTAEINAAKQLSKEIGTYKFLASIQAKGDDARFHIGMTVQRAIEIMESHGLSPFAYGFICFDSWEDEFVEHPETESEAAWVEQTRTAGNRYAFRYDQLNLFIAAGIEARLTALEAQ